MDTPLFDGELVHARRMIYTPSAFAKSNLVHLQEVGQLQARSPHASTRQGLASYLFFVVESSRAFTRKIPHPTPAVSKHCTRWRPLTITCGICRSVRGCLPC